MSVARLAQGGMPLHTHQTPRKYLELIQDVIVFGLCAMLFVAMGTKLFHLGQLMMRGIDFALVVGDILFILVLLELFRLLLLYLEEQRVSTCAAFRRCWCSEPAEKLIALWVRSPKHR